MNRNDGKFWDVNSDGKFDIVDVFWVALQVVAYAGGLIFMGSTFVRSFHLLSSSQMMPQGLGDAFSYWPWLTSIAPEAGLIMAWLSGEVGFRKGQWPLVAISVVGGLVFGIVIATMNLYDVALIEGGDLSDARGWAHTIAAILPLITIAYSALVTMILSAMARWNKVKSTSTAIQSEWKEKKRQGGSIQYQPRLEADEQESFLPIAKSTFGERVIDPAHLKATKLAEDAATRSNGHNRPKAFSE